MLLIAFYIIVLFNLNDIVKVIIASFVFFISYNYFVTNGLIIFFFQSSK